MTDIEDAQKVITEANLQTDADCLAEIRKVLKKHGWPEDLIIGVEDISVDRSKELMSQCDVILASCPKPSVGTSMEILLGWQQGKLIVVVIDAGAVVNPWLVEHSHVIVYRYDQACSYIAGWAEMRRDDGLAGL